MGKNPLSLSVTHCVHNRIGELKDGNLGNRNLVHKIVESFKKILGDLHCKCMIQPEESCLMQA